MKKQNIEILIVVVLGTFVVVSLVAPLLTGTGVNTVVTGGVSGGKTVLCSDSDGGIDLETRGTCTDFQLNEDFTDYCESDILIEYRCATDGCTSLAYRCSNGCADGACNSGLNA